jgi:hypothetical protein
MLLDSTIIGFLSGDSFPARAAASEAPSAASSTASTERAKFEPRVAARAWKSIVLHHSATAAGDVASIDAAHRRQKDSAGRPWRGIGYHFVVGNGQTMADGEIQPTFRWLDQLSGAHTGAPDYNEQGIGICLIGNFDQRAPTERQVAATRRLVEHLAGRFTIDRPHVLRHQDAQATRCPGKLFPYERITAGLAAANEAD